MVERLKYHQAALDFIGEEIVFSQKNIELLNEFERDFNLKLPPSLREWFSLERAEQILSQYSNGDGPVSADELKNRYLDLQWRGKDYQYYYDPFELPKLLPVMVETQGCFDWRVYLDGSDDPPVYVTGETLELFTKKFSDFVYTHVWDWSGLFTEHSDIVDSDPNETFIAFMRQNFQETTRTFSFDYIGGAAYRFFDQDKCVLIKTGIDAYTWYVWAVSSQSLKELKQTLKQNIPFQGGFQAKVYGDDNTEPDKCF